MPTPLSLALRASWRRGRPPTADVAQALGVSEHTVRSWRSGRCLPSEHDLERLLDYLSTYTVTTWTPAAIDAARAAWRASDPDSPARQLARRRRR